MDNWQSLPRLALKSFLGLIVIIASVYWWLLPWSLLANFVGLDSRTSTFWGQAHPALTFAVGFLVVLTYYIGTVVILYKLWQSIGVIQGRRHDRNQSVVEPV